MLDWDKLKLFYQVANAGSITTAAERLNLSQPALSRSMLNLEARLNTQLFTRHKHGISLTRQGQILYGSAQKMYAESRYVEQALLEDFSEVEGELTVLTTPALASSWLMRYMPSFMEKYPDIRLKIIGHVDDDDFNMTDVQINTFLPRQPTMVQHFITTFTMRLYASQSYIDRFGMPESAEDLDRHRLISFISDPRRPLSGNWILQVGHQYGSVREPFMQFNNAPCILRAAELGLGIVELGKGYPASEGVELVEVLPDLKGPVVDIFYIYPDHKKNSRKIMALLEHISGEISPPSSDTENELEDNTIKLANLG